MEALEAERAEVEARLAHAPATPKPLLHPAMGAVYRDAVARLRETLETGDEAWEAVALLRGLIERIVLHPEPGAPAGYVLDLEGDLAGILALCHGQDGKKAAGGVPGGLEQIKLVAGVGFEPTTFRL